MRKVFLAKASSQPLSDREASFGRIVDVHPYRYATVSKITNKE